MKDHPNDRLLGMAIAESTHFMSNSSKLHGRSRPKHPRWIDVIGWVALVAIIAGYLYAATY